MSKDLALWLGAGILALLLLGSAATLVKTLGWKCAAIVLASAAAALVALHTAEALIAWGLTS